MRSLSTALADFLADDDVRETVARSPQDSEILRRIVVLSGVELERRLTRNRPVRPRPGPYGRAGGGWERGESRATRTRSAETAGSAYDRWLLATAGTTSSYRTTEERAENVEI